MSLCSTSIKWSDSPYKSDLKCYQGIEKTGGSWPLNYFKRDNKNNIVTMNGERVPFQIAHPCAFDFSKEIKIVEDTLNNLTFPQIQMAKFWGTGIPLNQLQPIIISLVDTYQLNPIRAVRVNSIINKAMMDGFIICWHFKYLWNLARPIQYNPQLKTVLSTPKFPSYPSGHSVVSAVVTTVLSYFFPKEKDKLDKIAEEASMSRLYAGIHFKPDLYEGVRLGRYIGNLIIEEIIKDMDKDGVMIDIPELQFKDAPINPDYEKVK
ncbi:MAG: phosphatase PAP2 family protein [Clostridium sp.]